MLNFVAANNQRYKWDCHVFFSMHETYLDTWLKKMAYWGTKADELVIYALSDMLNVHSFIIMKNCPWTTVDASVKGTVLEVLNLCPVKLVFLGDNRFGRLWPKLKPSMNVSTPQTSFQPVFPDAQLLVNIPAPPTLAKLETAETLLTMQENQGKLPQQTETPQSVGMLDLQEPSVKTFKQPTELVLENPPVTTDEQCDLEYTDAMDKIVNHVDVSFTEPGCWLKFRDSMDLITGRISELVETVNLSNLMILDQIKTPPCRVELVRIKFTPTLKLPTLQTSQDLITLGEYFTRSKSKPQKHRQCR